MLGDLIMSGDLGGTGGTVPPKFEVGDGPSIGPPNIMRSSVVGWARKPKESKKIGVIKEFFVERGLFAVKKGSYMIFDRIKTQNLKRESQNQKNLVND